MATPHQKPNNRLSAVIGRVANLLSRDSYPTSDRATLRRIVPGQPIPLVFYKLALQHLPEGWEYKVDDWAAIIGGIALMAPMAHRYEQGLGQALATAGYSENRLERLLAAKGNTRRTLLLRAARFLSAKQTPFNWVEAARLLLTSEYNQEVRDRLYQDIAKDYYYQILRRSE